MYGRIIALERAQAEFFFSRPQYALGLIAVVVLSSLSSAFPGAEPVYNALLNIVPLLVLLIYVRSRIVIYKAKKQVVCTVLTVAFYFLGFLATYFSVLLDLQNRLSVALMVIAILAFWHVYFVLINISIRGVPRGKYLLQSVPVLVLVVTIALLFSWMLLINSLMLATTNDRVYQKVFWMLSLVVLFFSAIVLYEIPFMKNDKVHLS